MPSYTRAELWLLKRFIGGDALDGGGYAAIWARVGGYPAVDAIARFRDRGLIELAPAERQLSYGLSKADLKEKARVAGVAVGGTQAAIAARLAKVTSPSEVPERIGVCTPAGQALAQAFVEDERIRRADAETGAAAAIEKGDLSAAAQIGAVWDMGQVFPSGLGMDDFTVNQRAGLVLTKLRLAEFALSERPAVLQALSDDEVGWLVRSYQRSAAMSDDGSQSPELTQYAEVGGLAPKTAMRLLYRWVANRQNLESFKKNDFVQAIKIAAPPDCIQGQELSHRQYNLDDVPELPNPTCERALGCGCTYGIVVQRDR